MNKARSKLEKLASNIDSQWKTEAAERQKGQLWKNRSVQIALLILDEIDRQKKINGMNQKRLAKAMDVSPQYVNKIINGSENLTLETITKTELALGVKLIEVCTENASISDLTTPSPNQHKK